VKISMIARAVVVTLAITTSAFVLPAVAQDQSGSTSAPSTQQPRSADQVVSTLATQLNLSEDQIAKIKPVIIDRQTKIQSLRSDTSMRPRKKMQEIKAIFEDSDKKVEAVLNGDQKKQYIAIEQEQRQQMRDRMQNRGNSGTSNFQ